MTVPAKRKKPRETRRFDTTQCREATYRDFVHRDYLAHCFRWSWVSRLVKPGQSVLDVGCGVEAQLARALAGTTFVHGGHYVGVDMNRLTRAPKKPWSHYYGEFDFTSRYGELLTCYQSFDVVACLEVVEHMGPEDGARLLAAIHACMKPDGVLYLSTPVLGAKQAANHVHEYTVLELQAAIEAAGLKVVARRGTFASWPSIKKVIGPQELAVAEALRQFHGDDVMACFLAPLHPDASRNCFWVLARA